MARTFRAYLLDISPPWLLTKSGAAFMAALGEVKDSILFRLREAARIRFLRFASDDALLKAGEERGIPRSAGEDSDTYRARLIGAWDAWKYAGTALGMLRALYDSGYPNVVLVIFNGKRYSLDAEKKLVVEDLPSGSWKFRTLEDTYWSLFDVLFIEPLPADWVANGVPASSSEEADFIRSIIRSWKPAHMACDEILVASSPETWGYFPEGGTWGGDVTATFGDSTEWERWSP